MAKIRIIIDPGREGLPGTGDVVVESESDYLAARLRVRQSLTEERELTVWVRTGALAGRFDDLAQDPLVDFQRFDLRQELAALLGVPAVPEVVTAELIRACDLLATARRFGLREGESALAWCYRVLLDERWAKPTVTIHDIPAIIEKLANLDQPELKELVSTRLSAWGQSSRGARLWSWLAEDPFRRARAFAAYLAVRGYGDESLQWLTQAGFSLQEVQEAGAVAESLPNVTFASSFKLPEIIRQHLDRELKRRLAEEGVSAIRAAQARTDVEQRAVFGYLRERAERREPLSPEESRELTEWAAGDADGEMFQQIRVAAELMTETALPRPLAPNASWEQAAHWVEVEYMPAYISRAVTNRLEETTEAVASFEAWLSTHYGSLMQDNRAGLHWFCAGRQHLLSEGRVVLICLDGVPLPAVKWLRERLAQVPGVTVDYEGVHLAPVPSLTPIGKPVLLSARLPDQASAVEHEALAHSFGVPADVIRIAASPDDMSMLFPREVMFYHYRHIDEHLLHKRLPNFQRWLHCLRRITELADSLQTLLHRAVEEGAQLWLGCASDHGWTELPASATRVEYPQELATAETHHRVLAGVADSRYGIPLLAADFFLRDCYTVARGYSYLGSKPHGATHGGMTPQEVMVYGLWLTTAPVAALSELVLEVRGEIRRAIACNPADLQIKNPNAEEVTVTEIDLSRVTPTTEVLPLSVAAGGEVEVSVVCDASSCTDMLQIQGTIAWVSKSGRRRDQQVDFWVPTKGAATTDRDFEDMFRV